MKTLKILMLLLLAFAVILGCNDKNSPAYKNSKLTIDQRTDDLLNRMTLDEKLAQIGSDDDTNKLERVAPGFLGFMNKNLAAKEAAKEYNIIQYYYVNKTRLGIPALRSGEGIFAYMGNGSTSFPQSIAMACSWEPEVIQKMADALGDEMKARGIRSVLGPVVNIPRDCRWGRTGETYGEDPYLSGIMGAAYAKTMEQKGIITCAKHFAANMGLDGKFASQVHFTQRLLREIYFPSFKACFQQGGSKSVMMAYNTIDGIDCFANKWMITDVLRNEWGFDGYVMSDGGALQLAFDGIKTDSTKKEMVARAFKAGCDLSDFNGQPLKEALKDGLVSESDIDKAVRRVLRQKFRIGLFENPFADPQEAERINNCNEHRLLSREIAEKSIVLLKNENNILPLSKKIESVAVLGPMADWLLINHYGGWGRKEISILEGLKNYLPNAKITYEKGAEMGWVYQPAIKAENFIGGLNAEYFENKNLEGKPKYVKKDANIEFDWKNESPKGLPHDGFSVRWTGKLKAPVTGKFKLAATVDDGVRVFIDGKKVLDMWIGGNRRISETDIILEQGNVYDFKMEYFDDAHLAYAQIGWNVDPFINIQKAVNAAKQADVAIIAVGMRDDENEDRANLDLDDAQEKLILEVAKLGKPMVVIIQTGTVISMYDWVDKAPAILQAWYPGEEGGNAITRILFGDVNPSAKLVISIPKVTGQVPLNYNHYPYKIDDRYIGYGNDPQFSFGHGLSFTTFEYSNLVLSSKIFKKGDSIQIALEVKNTGKMDGQEIVQLYTHDEVASVVRPVMELKGYNKIFLKAGETKKVIITIQSEQLMIYNSEMKYVLEPGNFKVMIGSSSSDIRLQDIITAK